MSLVSHIEKHLGTIDKGWSSKAGTSSVQIVRFNNKPFDGCITYSTLGLSDHILLMSGDKSIRQELIFSAYDNFSSEDIASFLMSFAEYILSKGQALLRGDVVGPSNSLIPSIEANSIYSAMPVIFDDEFATYKETTPPVVMVWLLPLLGVESVFVKESGWDAFESLLESKDPDLWDLNRKPVV